MLFLNSSFAPPCAVSTFTSQLVKRANAHQIYSFDLKAIMQSDSLALNLPLVGWKKTFFLPLFIMFTALILGKKRVIMLHEWADLNWKRRLFFVPLLLLSSKILISSPLIFEQLKDSIIYKFLICDFETFPVPSLISFKETIYSKPSNQLTIGHFGSIYPSKNTLYLLKIAAKLKEKRQDFTFLFIGSFIKGSDRIEQDFWASVKKYGLESHVKVTGYIDSLDDLHHLFANCSCFLYPFTEGLTARRTSVLAVAQAGRPIITTKPKLELEFAHHDDYLRLIDTGLLHFVTEGYIDEIIKSEMTPSIHYSLDARNSWQKIMTLIQK